jgi:hypothetical protein
MFLLTCKDFLSELNEYLDETADPELRKQLEQHVNECPNCWVVVDTTKKTLQIYKHTEPQDIPERVHRKLTEALERRIAAGPPGRAF